MPSSPRSAWDLIVVGAGSAGAALATRCAERGRRVLLLEAGPDYRSSEMAEVWRSPNPIQALLHKDGPGELVWPDLLATRTTAQTARLYWRGRGVGGSSAINGQIAIRPPVDDFDDWAAAGCTGWAWSDVLPYFCRIETDVDFGDAPYHGSSGPVPVWRTPRADWGSVDEALAVEAARLGFGWSDDVNAPGATGVSPYPINSRDARRVSTNDAYLEPCRELANLVITGDALVDTVIIEHGRAVGVELTHGETRRAQYGDEVVLAAGAIHTPAILIRSGIGPAADIAALGLDPVVDLPVGRGLQDHPTIFVNLPLRREASIKTLDDRHTNCCVRYSSDDPDGTSNDLMFIALNQAVLAMETADTAEGAGAIGVWLNHGYSRGTVCVTSRDPRTQPTIEERMLSDERDRRRMRDAVRQLAELTSGERTSGICRLPVDEANPDLWEALRHGDKALDRFLLASATDAQHGTSTCAMGRPDSATSVVDPDCRVLGVEHLRVADASIFPTCPRANTNLATIVVGEVVADRLD